LLIDTYDTEQGARHVVEVARQLKADGIPIRGVRIDSGDLAEHAKNVRAILDAGGLRDPTIFASGNLDEWRVRELLAAGAPINGFGIGTRLDVSADLPYLDCAYKLQEYAGLPKRKRSEGKATWPGRKQVYRTFAGQSMTGDVIALETDEQPGQPLLQLVMQAGQRVLPAEQLNQIRQRTSAEVASLPTDLRQLEKAADYPVAIAESLRQLAQRVDQGCASASG
jgi:nicotinate phosphoribosyltransferase